MTYQQAHTIVGMLQKDHFFYRNFGVWWWHVKSELKRHGFKKNQLYHLGDFFDPSVDEFYEGKSEAELDNEAYEYQRDHTFHKYNSNAAITPDGDPYLIHDQDAE